MSKVNAKIVKRAKRLAALMIGVGIVAPGAGNWLGMNALTSAIFGGIMTGTGIIAALSLIYASKGEVPDADFDKAINDQIEQVRSQRDSKKHD